jgi:hypothetical protein
LLIRGYIEEVFNKHQPETSDRFVATDFIEHNPRLGMRRLSAQSAKALASITVSVGSKIGNDQAGARAMTRNGLPEPSAILSGAAMTTAPVGGN